MKNIKFHPKAVAQLKQMFASKAALESNIRIYLQGIMDSNGLEGTWDFNTNTWKLEEVKQESKKEEQKDE